ncbi:innexin unc-9-like isoform X1 [Liolophura sinensis]|uniref:innexin unc-9-like isoform X1 n=1 Tax=Liolophura sinensis TaxID=3198878 RepID=UPI00315967FE
MRLFSPCKIKETFRKILPAKRAAYLESGQGSDEMTTSRAHVIFAILLAALAVVTGYLQYFAKPAQCWSPPEFTQSMVDYSNSVCYFSNQYYVPIDDLPIPEPIPTAPHTNYYKWTPFGLLFLSVLYVIPELVKNMASKVFQLNLGNILELSHQSVTGSDEIRLAAIKQLTADLQYRLDGNKWKSKKTGFLRCIAKISPSLTHYIWLEQFAGKLCVLIGSIVPIYFLYKYLGLDVNFYDQVVNNKMPSNETYFPDQILCDLAIRRFGNIVRFTLQCHVPANDMFKRISLLVGFLALVVSSVSSSDVICSLVARLFEPRICTYIKRHMSLLTEQDTNHENEECQNFTQRHLGADGKYLLWLIGQSSSETVVCQILSRLWATYKIKRNEEKPPPYFADKTPLCGNLNAAFTDW